MSRYRKIEVKTWADEKFCGLSPMPPSGQGLWLFLMTGPHTGPIPGLFRAGRAGMAEELGWELEDFDKAFAEVFQQGMAQADFKARLVWLPNALKHNKPESPNVVRSWRVELDLLSECDLKREAIAGLRAHLETIGPSYVEAFDEFAPKVQAESPKSFAKPSAKPSPNQEQEQEQEQKQEQEEKPPRKRVATPPIARPEDVCESVWRDWTALRAKKRTTVSETAIEGARAEAAKAGLSLEAFLRIWVTRGSQGMEAAWIKPEERRAAASFAERDREEGMRRWEEMTGRVHPDRQPRPAGVVIDMPATPQLAIGGRQ